MSFSVYDAINWILFLALFPMAFIWLRKAHRIFVKKDYSEVALKGGELPPDPEKYAVWAGLINLITGVVAAWLILSLPIWIFTGIQLIPSDNSRLWTEIAAGNLWAKIFADFILSRQAHPFKFGKDKSDETAGPDDK
jgi:hypothetical protein